MSSAERVSSSKYLERALRRLSKLVTQDPEVARARPTPRGLTAIRESGAHPALLVEAACRTYGDRPCLASRSPHEPAFTAVTYRTLWERVTSLAAGLRDVVQANDLVLLAGPAGVEWVVADLACWCVGAVTVPLHETASREDLAHILGETRPALAIGPAARLAEITCPTIAWEDAAFTESRPPVPPRLRAPDGDPLFSVVYTSGSTGKPKGVMLPERRWVETLVDALSAKPLPAITVGYLPLAHMAGRIGVYATMMTGGLTSFVAKTDMSTLLDDLRLARPVNLTLVPRVSSLFYQRFQSELLRRGARWTTAAAALDDPRAAEIMAELRASVGGRLCFVATGAAPTPRDVVAFLERCFEVPVTDAYGSTEMGSIAVNGRVQPWVSYKLVDAPELGYTRADRPYPRGELAVKSAREAPGYYGNEEASAKLRDEDGYVLSGDIVEERAPGHVVWLDRRHGVLRLAQGEFVNLSRLEDLFATESPLVEQIYVYGNPARSYVLAVVVPRAEMVQEGDDARRLVRAAIADVAARANLPSHEVPRDVVVELAPFSAENGLLTDARKPRRPKLRERYGARLEALYEEIEARQIALDPGEAATPGERIRAAVAAALGVEVAAVDPNTSYARAGGDSLGAVRLAALLRDNAGLSVPVAELLDPRITIAELARRVEEGSGADFDFASVHGGGAAWSRAKDLASAADGVARVVAATGAVRRVLLTGASGFLGHFVLRDLVARGVDVTCVVRGESDDDATARLGAPSPRVRAVAGDLMRPDLGLAPAVYEELASGTDAVVHAGALVNHALSYPHLFVPNVAGTREIARFAARGKAKALHFVSTTGIALGIKRTVTEDDDAASLWARRPTREDEQDYAFGYATSKWAAEVVLGRFHACAGLPITITRCGMILPHTELAAPVNESDAFSRLVYGIVRTGLAPESFFAPGFQGSRHYDGLPVDVVSGFLARLATARHEGLRIYHAANAIDDDVSLDTIVTWIGAAHPIARLPYDAWLARFRARLEALAPSEQARSPLPILFRWASPARVAGPRIDTARFCAALDAPLVSLDERYIAHASRSILAAS